MEIRKLGNSTLQVAPWAFGGNVFGWTVDEVQSFRLLDAFTEAGFNFIDTADVYSRWAKGNSGGESETIIGRWIKQKGNRDKVVVASKVGMEMAADKKGLSKKYILQSVEDSLRRLQTDYIDLYQSHKDDPDIPVEETLSAYNELVKQGKVRVIGASNFSAARLKESLEASKHMGYPVYHSLQPHYNLYERAGYEQALEPLCLQHNIGVISYYSLASGFLTGKYRSEKDTGKSARGGGMSRFFNDRGFRILAALDEVAGKYNATPAQVAMAWLVARPGITAPIASATSIEQVNDLAKGIQLKLDTESIQALNTASEWR